MRAYLAGCIGLLFAAQAYALSLNELSQKQAGDGMTAMLKQSARMAVQQLGQPGDFKFNNFAGQAASFGVIDSKDASIENYVTEQALDGLFSIIAEQEASIRQTPAQAASDIVKKDFVVLC